MVPPYKGAAKNNSQNKEFNQSLLSVCIDIEHAFGILQGRWKSLTGLRLILTTQKKYEFACMWITACLVLHNILLDLDDNWRKDEGWWTNKDEEEYDEDMIRLSQSDRNDGRNKREAVKWMVLSS